MIFLQNSNLFEGYSGEELTILITVAAIIISQKISVTELGVLGALLTSLADQILLISAQRSYLQQISSEEAPETEVLALV